MSRNNDFYQARGQAIKKFVLSARTYYQNHECAKGTAALVEARELVLDGLRRRDLPANTEKPFYLLEENTWAALEIIGTVGPMAAEVSPETAQALKAVTALLTDSLGVIARLS